MSAAAATTYWRLAGLTYLQVRLRGSIDDFCVWGGGEGGGGELVRWMWLGFG